MFDGWLGPGLLMLFVLGIVRSVVAVLIYLEVKQQRSEWVNLQAKLNGTPMNFRRRGREQWRSRHLRSAQRRGRRTPA